MVVIRTNQLIRKELESERFKSICFIDHSNLDKNEFLYDSKHFRINGRVKIWHTTNIKKATRSGKHDNIRTKTIRPNMKTNRPQPSKNDEHLTEKLNKTKSSNTNPDMMLQVLEQLKQMNAFLINTRSPLPPPIYLLLGPIVEALYHL